MRSFDSRGSEGSTAPDEVAPPETADEDFLDQLARALSVNRSIAQQMLGRYLEQGSRSRRAAARAEEAEKKDR